MGNYHHHQNPSAFKLDLTVISTVCVIYNADGLYALDSTQHSPLIGFAYDGFPIYGGYGYKNADGTGGISRMKSSYSLRNITTRTTYAGSTVAVTPGPAVSATYPLGYFREDYQYNPTTTLTPDYLDSHNGRFCVTPEYPAGTYCYFATVKSNWNSAYPYVVGPTFYGTKVAAKVTSITESVTTYTPASTGLSKNGLDDLSVAVYPNPASDFIVVQLNILNKENVLVEMFDMQGKLIQKTSVLQGSTMAYLDTKTVYAGQYFIKFSGENGAITKKITITK
jgi:hypothetical protein